MKIDDRTLKLFSIFFVALFTIILFASSSYSSTDIVAGKYRVVIKESPKSICAVWINENTGKYIFRVANEIEYNKLSKEISGLSIDAAISVLENIQANRVITDKERLLCLEAKALDNKALKAVPSKTGERTSRDLETALIKQKEKLSDKTHCEGPIIKKYQKNRHWRKAVGYNLAILCGVYKNE